jgi:hypothetical protein
MDLRSSCPKVTDPEPCEGVISCSSLRLDFEGGQYGSSRTSKDRLIQTGPLYGPEMLFNITKVYQS